MTRHTIAILALLFAGLLAVRARAAEPVEYTMRPVIAADALRAISVTMSFEGESDGETILALPDEWGGEESLWRGLNSLQILPGSARLAAGADSAHRVIRHEPGTRLLVSYRIEQDWQGKPAAGGDNTYRPVVQPGYFHLIGHAAFAIPEWSLDTPVLFQIAAMPEGWQFASDLEHGDLDSSLTLGNLRESVLVGGDFRVLRSPQEAGLRLAIRGEWKFTDATLYDTLLRIVSSHLEFWGDPDEPFLVTVLPLVNDLGGSSLGGTGLTDAFAFFGTDNGEEATLNRILAHEHLHTWIPRRIGGMPDPDEARDYWLSEGFTDFYTFRLLVRDGTWSVDDFVAATNEVLERYAASSARTEPNSRILQDFWSSRDIQDLPYQRGFLMAMTWDDRLRRLSGGKIDLDDVMHAMKVDAMSDPANPDSLVASDRLRLALTLAGLDPTDDLEQFIEQGNALLLPEDLLGPQAAIETVERPEFTRGFDSMATNAANGVVAGVDPTGPAWAAGLRDGMTIIKREAGKQGDSRIELVYLVRDGDTERRIRYLPEGKRRFVTQQIVPTTGLDDAGRMALARRIGGE